MEISAKILNEKLSNDDVIKEEVEEILDEATIAYRTARKAKLSVDDLKSDILSRDNNMLPYIKSRRKRVIIVTPFLIEKLNMRHKLERYVNMAMIDSLQQNEAPIASQSMYVNLSGYSGTNIERDVSFIVQLNWALKAELVAFYVDYEMTPAMESMLNYCLRKNIKTEIRSIGVV